MLRSRLLFAIMLLPLTAFAAERETRELRDPAARHVIITPAASLTDADRAALANEGIRVERPLSGGRFTALVERGANVTDARLGRVDAMTIDQKVHASAWRVAAQARPFAHVKVFFHDDVAFDEARSAIVHAGGALDDPMAIEYEPLNGVKARIAPAELTELASDDRVLVVYGERHVRARNYNAVAAALSHVNAVQAGPYNLSGDQVVLSTFELGTADKNHQEFGGRLTVEFTCSSSDTECNNNDNKQHATHTSGTIIAAGVNPDAKGMAPKATLHEYRANHGNWLTQKQTTLNAIHSVADNNSWGYTVGWVADGSTGWEWTDDEELIGGYTGDLNAVLDHVAFLNGSLMVHASGNEGDVVGPKTPPYQHNHVNQDDPNFAATPEIYCVSPNGSGNDCASPCRTGKDKWGDPYCETALHPNHAATTSNPGGSVNWLASGKNIMTVGSVTQSEVISGFSSRGPARDGRVKPEIVAKGNSLFSTVYTGTSWSTGWRCSAAGVSSYACAAGTSMATPVVTGTTALLVEQWRKLNAGASPTPQTLKALLIAGADDLGNPGPDYTYGFGMLNAKTSIDLIVADNGSANRVKTDKATTGAGFDYPVSVGATQDLRVVLAWFDPEVLPLGSEEIADKTLVNDLDVKVLGPNGITTLPYVLDVNNPGANASRGVNTVDNTEEVEIKGAAPGQYHVIVSGGSVPQGPAQFVVVSNADFATAPPPCVDATEPNDSTAYPIPNGVGINAAICSATDVDLFSFAATAAGAVSVTITATQTPLKATLLTNGVAGAPITIAPGATGTLTSTAGAGTTQYVVRVEPNGAIGTSGAYTITASAPFTAGPRRRAIHH
jgi:hypothetical protein